MYVAKTVQNILRYVLLTFILIDIGHHHGLCTMVSSKNLRRVR